MAFITFSLLFSSVIVMLSLLFLLQILLHYNGGRKGDTLQLTNWPVVGMLPGFLCNLSRIWEFRQQILKQNGWTFVIKGPWFAKMDIVFTSDPLNVHHILTKSFTKYVKGETVEEIFEVLGDGILNVDSDLWKSQRKLVHSLIKNSRVENYLRHITWRKVEKGLFSVLEYVSEQEITVDLQDVSKRFTFDTFWQLVFGDDPNSLSVGFPEIRIFTAFDDVEEVMFYRTTVPASWWKLQKWLQIGQEKKFTRACRFLDEFLDNLISLKQEKLRRMKTPLEEEEGLDLLTASMVAAGGNKSSIFFKDMAKNLFAAGRDTVSAGLTWFFWLVATHPSVENKILQEIKANIEPDTPEAGRISFNTEMVNKLVYLHAALCETLRLHPTVPIIYKCATEADTLPTGHHINQKANVFVCTYVMGQMEEIWGKDCSEFKPERWISEKGGIVHVPSYNFSAYGAGPRTCLGKDISLIQMKMVTASVLWNYRIQVAEGHPGSPSNFITLFMKHGLKVRVFKRK